MLRRTVRLLLVAAMLTTLMTQVRFANELADATTSSEAAARPYNAGRWLVAPDGRVLVLNGVNMVYKVGSYAPDEAGFGADDAAFLARNGLNTVRLGIIWKAVEPEPGTYDDAYLARIRHTAMILARHGIWTLLDFHQDMYNEKFQGEGAPDWAVQDDGIPAQPQLGFPDNYVAMPALDRAFDHFWANDPAPDGVGLQDHYAAAWAHVAQFFRGTPHVMGFDLFNEPWPGSQAATCANTQGCPVADQTMTDFVDKVVGQIRTVDASTVAYYEPWVLFNYGAASSVAPTDAHLGFSFHDYCLAADVGLAETGLQQAPCSALDDKVWTNMENHVADGSATPLLTEFGATNDQTTLTTMVDRAEQHMVGWQYWAYCGCGDPTTTGSGSVQALVFDAHKKPVGTNVDWAKMRSLVIPHPMVVAGTPVDYSFARDTRQFTFTYTTSRPGGGRFVAGSRTVVSVPRIQYPHGYSVAVAGAKVVSEPNAPHLVLRLLPGVTKVLVGVRPL